MKIVAIDNFDRDWIPEHVVASDLAPEEALRRCAELNDEGGVYAEWYHVVRDDAAMVRTLVEMHGTAEF